MNSSQAHNEVYKAVKSGHLTRLDTCELCGVKARTVAHHYNGYNNPLDVWYICYSCNSSLCGYHDGSLTREQAREVIAAKEQAKKWIVACRMEKNTNLWHIKFQGVEAQARKVYQSNVKAMWKFEGIVLLNPIQEIIESVGDTSTLFE
jgi:hypothetical protein